MALSVIAIVRSIRAAGCLNCNAGFAVRAFFGGRFSRGLGGWFLQPIYLFDDKEDHQSDNHKIDDVV